MVKFSQGLKRKLNRIFSWIKWIAIAYVLITVLAVILFRFVNPPVTPLMIFRKIHNTSAGKKAALMKKWVPIEKISPNMIQAVVASEDNLFLDHWGVDFTAIEKAIEHNEHSRRKHGASTISQQTAKNLFLWPSRTWLRKGFELYFTGLMELIWSKKRIMEVYLNIIETGDGIYGVESAANIYFKKSSMTLSKGESVLIAVSLPDPRRRNPAKPGPYMLQRQAEILDLMGKIEQVKFQ
jgi:monofunctional biosynthetic peptidoglycan transglycosylase